MEDATADQWAEAEEQLDWLMQMIEDWHRIGEPQRIRDNLRRELAATYSNGYFQHAANMHEEPREPYRNPYYRRPASPAGGDQGADAGVIS